MIEIRFHGRGGQGAVIASKILACAFFAEGKWVQSFPKFGCDKNALTETTFKNEAETNLFSEQAVTCGGLPALVCTGYEVLVEAGYPADLAYAECVKNTKRITDLLEQHGIAGMYERISRTAAYGGLTRGPQVINKTIKERMKKILADTASGKFAKEWMAEASHKAKKLDQIFLDVKKHPINKDQN